MAATVNGDHSSKKLENRGQYKEIFTGPKGFDRKTELEGSESQPKATVSLYIEECITSFPGTSTKHFLPSILTTFQRGTLRRSTHLLNHSFTMNMARMQTIPFLIFCPLPLG